MSLAASFPAPRERAAGAPWTGSSGQAFGLEVEAPLAVPLASNMPGGRSLRKTALDLAPAQELGRRGRPRDTTTALERRFPDGSLVMSVEHAPELGYRIYAPRAGRHLVAGDGRHVLSALPKISAWRWQRLLFAQVLPLAATLQGLELLHASAVELDGQTLAFVAASGVGKTSVAAHLVAEGASLLTDDVLAVERSSEGIVAHPGAPILAVAPSELDAMSKRGRSRLGTVVGQSDKTIVHVDVLERSCKLDAVFFLGRSPCVRGVLVEQVHASPIRLLSNSFNSYVGSERRVVNQLAVHAQLARAVRLFEVVIPPARPATEVAAAVAEYAAWAL
jgi:hypothetical protein